MPEVVKPTVGVSEAEIVRALESAKFRLLGQIARDKKLKHELSTKIAAAEVKVLERRTRLGEYNALFMTLEDSAVRAPRQRLGASGAVAGTRRIIERELGKVGNEIAARTVLLNKMRDRNIGVKAQVDELRKGQLTFLKLFSSMNNELQVLKDRIADVRKAIDDGYSARDRAQEEMRGLAKQFEVDKLERQREWALYSAAIEEANREGHSAAAEDGTGLLTAEEEDSLRKKIRKGHMKMAKDRGVLQTAQQKLAAFQEALMYIRTSTGYEQLPQVVELFNKYEEEKFEKLAAVNRMVIEIEQLEAVVASTRDDVRDKDAEDIAISTSRRRELAALKGQAELLEKMSIDSRSSTERIQQEVHSIFPVIEVAFHILGCYTAVRNQQQVSDLGASPMRHMPTASLKMYASPVVAAEFSEGSGVTVSSLPQYMGVLETRASDLVQLYAAMVATGALLPDGEEGNETQTKVLPGTRSIVARAGATQSHFLSPAAIGPSRPTGKLKESLTTSALVAAMASSTTTGADAPPPRSREGQRGQSSPVRGEEDDDVGYGGGAGVLRPLSRAELKRQAVAHLAGSRNVRAIAGAATAASSYLSRVL